MIGQNSVVSMHYTLKNDNGDVLDSSEGKPPMMYLHGANNLIPGLEAELTGKSTGAAFNATIQPEQAYGTFNEELIQVISKSLFEGVETIEVGMAFIAQGEGGAQRQVRVTDVDGDSVTIDANHPLAGMTLHFDVEVVEVREATAQEIEDGQVHTGSTSQ
ncbi:MAG: peptidylprolyl isomerase [Pseudomonadales bacterium]|nr:peptidylprolyl isomerase [Pseudomonadales bacterium]